MENEYSAILFDFDGVLARTMEDNFHAWRRAVGDFGYRLLPDQYFPLEGMNISDIALHFCKLGNILESEAEEIVQKKEHYYTESHSFTLYPFVEEFIDILIGRHVSIAVVSAARMNRLTLTVPPEFLGKFNSIITGEKGIPMKPDPAPYLLAAEQLRVPISKCIVVENAPLGVESAKAAGAYCIGILSTVSPEVLSRADIVISSFSDIQTVPVIQPLIS